MDIDNVREGVQLLKRGLERLSSGPLDYYLRTLLECHDLLIRRFAPAHIGDTVRLLTTPTINERESFGWLAYKHILKKGAVAKVTAVEADGRGFYFDLQFSTESGVFRFHENDVERVTDNGS